MLDVRQIQFDGLGDAAQDAQGEAVEQAIDAVWRAYNYGQARLWGEDPDKWVIGGSLAVPVVGPAISSSYAVLDWLGDDEEGRESAIAALKSMIPTIKKWETTLLAQAQAGVNAAGSAYSWEQWFDFGNTLIAEIDGIVDLGVEFSSFQARVEGARDRINEWINKIKKPIADLFKWVPWVIGGVAVVGLLVLYGNIKPALRAIGEEGEATVRAAGAHARRRFR